MRIVGPPSMTLANVNHALAKLTATPLFTAHIVPELWKWGIALTIDPVGAIAQSYKETGKGHFQGKVPDKFYNPCGLKIKYPSIVEGTGGDETLAHQMFPSWEVGCLAQIQHLRAYAGWELPEDMINVDPRYEWVIGNHACAHFHELGGKWAPSLSYGTEIESIMVRIITLGQDYRE